MMTRIARETVDGWFGAMPKDGEPASEIASHPTPLPSNPKPLQPSGERDLPLWKRTRRALETAFCRAGFWVCPRLPRRWLLTLARAAGACAYHLAVSQRRVALANLELALADSFSASERRRIARRSFQSFARTAMETLSAKRLLTDGLDRHFEFAPGSLDLLARLLAQKRGLIALTFHYGNWEWLSLAWGMAGYPATAVAQPIKNPDVEALFYARRQQAGHRLIHRSGRGGTAPRLYKALRRGEIIGLLVDLNSSVNEGGAFFDFFGVPALTTRVVGMLAMRTAAPVVCSVAYPQADGRYRIEIGPEIPYNPAAPLEQETNEITRRWLVHCEATIRKQPEFWMWTYKRWKVRPSPEPGRYPFYSFYDPKITAGLAPV